MGSLFEQSANFPGRVVDPSPDFFLTNSLAFFAAILALAASAAFSIILFPTFGFCSKKACMPSYTTLSTKPFTSPLPNFVFVCPSNWGS